MPAIIDDLLNEPTEMFGVTLSALNGNGIAFTLGSQNTATVEIMDNDGKHFML